MLEKKPTNKDVAELAGVSVATVSYVINGREDQKISEETKKKVFHAINFLNYAPNPHAVAMKTEQTKYIVVRSGNQTNTLRDLENLAFVREFNKVSALHGYVLYYSLERKPQRVSAMACICIDMTETDFHALASENFIPVIAVGSLIYDPVFYQITTDYAKLKTQCDTHFNTDYTYVTIKPNDSQLEKELLEAIPNTVFVASLNDLMNVSAENIAVDSLTLAEFFVNTDKNIFKCLDNYAERFETVLDCVEKAIDRVVIEDDAHYIKV